MLTETGNTYQEVQTPSGIEIRYHWEPERKYEIRMYDFLAEKERVPWKEVSSVTTVLDVLNKPGLPWWGMETGVKGLLQLQHYPGLEWETIKLADPSEIVKLLTKHKLSVNHVRDDASKRGHSVHAALEGWAKTGVVPDASIFPHEERPYVEGLVKFLNDIGINWTEDIQCEVIVGSLEYGYAGRYDLSFTLESETDVAYKWTPVRGPKYATLQPGRYMLDLKTSKGVYNTHHLQLAGYELASVECGYEPTNAQGILHVMDNGGYEFVRSLARPEEFVISLRQFELEAQLKQRHKERKNK